MSTVVFVHAHPDDEAIATGGTMAALAAAGHRVVLVTATVGELGEIPEGMLDDGESLADRRVVALAEAGRILGVARQAFLGYHDSGMAGEEPTMTSRFFRGGGCRGGSQPAGQDPRRGTRRRACHLRRARRVRAPDHVQVHTVGVRAADIAGTPRVFMATMDRGFLQSLAEQASQGGEEGWSPPEDTAADMQTMGEPSSRITTEVDVTKWIDAKRDAMRAHATQISEESFFLAMPPEVFEMVWGHEWYIRIRPKAPNPHPGPWETSLLDA